MSRGFSHRDYGWTDAEVDLAMGVNPAVVAARMGEPEEYVLEVADRQGWPITWKGADSETVAAANRIGWALDS